MQALIGPSGLPRWGVLDQLPSTINWRDFDARTALGKVQPGWKKRFLFKHFDFYGVASPEFTFGCGIVRLGLLNSTFGYLHSPRSGLHHIQFNLPLDTGLQACYSPMGTTAWQLPGNPACFVRSERDASSLRLAMAMSNKTNKLQANLIVDWQETQPLAVCTPVANTGFTYAQKTSGCAVKGEIHLNGQRFEVNPLRDGFYHDWTAGYLRRETFWNWASASGRQKEDQPHIALNMARGVNETSAHENVIWVDGQRYELPLALFDYDRDQVLKPWRVYSACGAVNLHFTPVGQVHDHRNLWVIASRFNQCFGSFQGTVSIPGRAQPLILDGLHGWCEDHYAKW